MEALGPVLVLMAIPLMLRWVPRNRLYGFRVAATLRDDVVWYDVNASSGRHFLVLGSVMVALQLVLPPALRDGILGAIAVVGLAVVVVVNWRRANRLARELGV
jgi:uncharacterized membrane protein